MWIELSEILRDLLNLYHELLVLAKKKKDIIIAAKMKELNEIVKQEQKLVLTANELEKKRRDLIVRMVKAQLIPSHDMDLSALLDHCEPAHIPILKKLRIAIRQVTQELQAINSQNGVLVGKALSFLEFNVNMLSQAQADPIYGGQSNNAVKVISRRLLDQKV